MIADRLRMKKRESRLYIWDGSNCSDWEEGYEDKGGGTDPLNFDLYCNSDDQVVGTTFYSSLGCPDSPGFPAEGTAVTKNSYDLTNYDTFYYRWIYGCNYYSKPEHDTYLVISSSKYSSHSTYTKQVAKSPNGTAYDEESSIDVSDLTGNYYVRLHLVLHDCGGLPADIYVDFKEYAYFE